MVFKAQLEKEDVFFARMMAIVNDYENNPKSLTIICKC